MRPSYSPWPIMLKSHRLNADLWTLLTTVVLVSLVATAGCRPEKTSARSSQTEAQTLRAERRGNQIRITVEGELFTVYTFAEDQKYPYFYPVNGPRSGESVTTESSEPWPHHHSLFFACDRVNGGNYWQEGLERGQIVAQETHIHKAEGPSVVFSQTSLWQRPGAPSPFRDVRRIRISAPSPDLRVIDFDITLIPLVDVRIEKTNHSLFSARMAPELSVENGGTLINAHGQTGEEGTWGEKAPWCDYWGTRNGITEGLAILVHPDNRWFPPPWFTRDYGFFSPTPMNWLEGGHLDLPKGEKLHLRYRVIVHGGTTEEAAIAKLYKAYIER